MEYMQMAVNWNAREIEAVERDMHSYANGNPYWPRYNRQGYKVHTAMDLTQRVEEELEPSSSEVKAHIQAPACIVRRQVAGHLALNRTEPLLAGASSCSQQAKVGNCRALAWSYVPVGCTACTRTLVEVGSRVLPALIVPCS